MTKEAMKITAISNSGHFIFSLLLYRLYRAWNFINHNVSVLSPLRSFHTVQNSAISLFFLIYPLRLPLATASLSRGARRRLVLFASHTSFSLPKFLGHQILLVLLRRKPSSRFPSPSPFSLLAFKLNIVDL